MQQANALAIKFSKFFLNTKKSLVIKMNVNADVDLRTVILNDFLETSLKLPSPQIFFPNLVNPSIRFHSVTDS